MQTGILEPPLLKHSSSIFICFMFWASAQVFLQSSACSSKTIWKPPS